MPRRILLITALLALAFTARADALHHYRITINNATAAQVITPPLIVIHQAGFSVFKVGSTASAGLVSLAETGNNADLDAELSSNPAVYSTLAAGNVIVYGQGASFEFDAPRKAHLSLAAMLATTNDGFAGLNDVPLPKQSAHYYAFAYDAGSETNNESCAYIPGPPCPPGSGNLRTDSGEGFISIHNGIHGGSDLNPKQLDWRGPVAVVTIESLDD